MATDALTCKCGKTALYRVGGIGYCSAHKQSAVARLSTHGNPRAKQRGEPAPLRSPIPTPTERKMQTRAKMRAQPTEAEAVLREILRGHPKTKGLYEFQPLLHGYLPDFLNRRAKLILEADGGQHYTKAGRQQDGQRTAHLAGHGYRVLRLPNRLILEQPAEVLRRVLRAQSR